MANRFVKRIRDGSIESTEELKAEFKTLAKETHPDLRGGAADGAEFMDVRDEYEAALRDFDRHRFGASTLRGGRGVTGGSAREVWACLALALKRGFPKQPRHEKEKARYAYSLWRLRSALNALGTEPALRLFDSCDRELSQAGPGGEEGTRALRSLLLDLIDYEGRRIEAMRTALAIRIASLDREPRFGPETKAFISLLAAELGIGQSLRGPTR